MSKDNAYHRILAAWNRVDAACKKMSQEYAVLGWTHDQISADTQWQYMIGQHYGLLSALGQFTHAERGEE